MRPQAALLLSALSLAATARASYYDDGYDVYAREAADDFDFLSARDAIENLQFDRRAIYDNDAHNLYSRWAEVDDDLLLDMIQARWAEPDPEVNINGQQVSPGCMVFLNGQCQTWNPGQGPQGGQASQPPPPPPPGNPPPKKPKNGVVKGDAGGVNLNFGQNGALTGVQM